MKNLFFLIISLVVGLSPTNAETLDATLTRYDGSRYIFVEGGVEFSVYPDGEFDFVLPQLARNAVQVNVNTGPLNISYNSGYNYDPYVQYDDYGAVLQIENVPIYYDNWGRIIQAGDVYINYNNGRIVNVGGLNVFYSGTRFSHVTGYINVYNKSYVYHPYHNYFYRPFYDRALVYNTPYRRYYRPTRYDYAYHRSHYNQGYRNGYANAYHDFKKLSELF